MSSVTSIVAYLMWRFCSLNDDYESKQQHYSYDKHGEDARYLVHWTQLMELAAWGLVLLLVVGRNR